MFLIVQEGYSIYGAGLTKEEAIEDVSLCSEALTNDEIASLEEPTSYGGDMRLYRCTDALYQRVKEIGGIAAYDFWDYRERILGTEEECSNRFE